MLSKKNRLKSWIGPQLCDITTEQLQESKVLCDSEAHFWLVDEPKNIMVRFFYSFITEQSMSEYYHPITF
jgi:hypothetical protein